MNDFVTYSFEEGARILSARSAQHRKQMGQYLTPVAVARFMARQLGPIATGARLLDPAVGSGVLLCAIIERLIQEGEAKEVWIDGYELDDELYHFAENTLTRVCKQAARQEIIVHVNLILGDFLNFVSPLRQKTLFEPPGVYEVRPSRYSHIISNPPYFKLRQDDPRLKALKRIKGTTNIYTVFMALAQRKLTESGKACFIVPRSFCSGTYFTAFRQEFIRQVTPLKVHLFDSRQENFSEGEVLQENIIIVFGRNAEKQEGKTVVISTSRSGNDINSGTIERLIPMRHFLGKNNGAFFFRLPTGAIDEEIISTIDSWEGSLKKHGLKVSTGPVVAFRTRAYLSDSHETEKNWVPLLWLNNVSSQRVDWPLARVGKPQYIQRCKETADLLLPVANYVLLRRFSAKEDVRRLVAAPLFAGDFNGKWIGFENHLNVISHVRRDLTIIEIVGLTAFLNCAFVDRYFRITNGNTQVNAADLRALPLPPWNVIILIGEKILAAEGEIFDVNVDDVVFTILRESSVISQDFPTIMETRYIMGKIQQAQEVLKALGMPTAQQNEISALTLLVLAQLSENMRWSEVARKSLRIHDILLEIKARYQREYAENTRETIRRQVIHQFEQAGLVEKNPDEPALPTNSPRTHYALSDAIIQVLRVYQTDAWTHALDKFLETQQALLEIYQRKREQHEIPLKLPGGEQVRLSPGAHNELQIAIIEKFGPRFAPGAHVLYLGDTANKMLVFNQEKFDELGIVITRHDKLPDVVLHDHARGWLFLIEVITSHGPVSPKRFVELEEMFKECGIGRVYVSAFPDFVTFKKFLTEIAWDTEVWLAEMPDHMIHFNGDRFLGPRP